MSSPLPFPLMNRSTSRSYIFGGEQPNFLLLRIHGATRAFVILSRELSEAGRQQWHDARTQTAGGTWSMSENSWTPRHSGSVWGALGRATIQTSGEKSRDIFPLTQWISGLNGSR